MEKRKKQLFWTLKGALSVGCVVFIVHALQSSDVSWASVDWSSQTALIFCIVSLLMVINWSLEALRWQVSIPHESISFHDSLRAVLSGLAMNWMIPFAFGDAGSRLLLLKKKKKSAVALIVNRMVMVGFTTFYGGIALLYYFHQLTLGYFILAFVIFIGALIGFIRHSKDRLFSQGIGLQLVLLTFGRYLIFTLQFVLLINHFLPEVSFLINLAGVGWIFFFRSFIPGLFGNFGIREASALVFYEPILSNPAVILVPCIGIWVINNVIPSIAGVFMLYQIPIKLAR